VSLLDSASELGEGAVAVEADVTDRDSIAAAAERVEKDLEGADVLVNNAGVMLLAPFSSDQHEETRQMVETNLLGAMTATEVFPTGVIRVIYAPAEAPAKAGYDEVRGKVPNQIS